MFWSKNKREKNVYPCSQELEIYPKFDVKYRHLLLQGHILYYYLHKETENVERNMSVMRKTNFAYAKNKGSSAIDSQILLIPESEILSL